MSRVQLALNVDDLDDVDRLLLAGCSAPSRPSVRPGYANFAVAEPPLKLVLIENPGQGGSSTTSASRSPTSTRSTPSRPGSPRPDSPRSTSAAPPAATPSRTSSGSRAPRTASAGRSTPSSPTARPLTAKLTVRSAARTFQSSGPGTEGGVHCCHLLSVRATLGRDELTQAHGSPGRWPVAGDGVDSRRWVFVRLMAGKRNRTALASVVPGRFRLPRRFGAPPRHRGRYRGDAPHASRQPVRHRCRVGRSAVPARSPSTPARAPTGPWRAGDPATFRR